MKIKISYRFGHQIVTGLLHQYGQEYSEYSHNNDGIAK